MLNKQKTPHGLTRNEQRKRIRYWKLGYTDEEIEQKTGINQYTIKTWRIKNKLPPNTYRIKGNNLFEEFLLWLGKKFISERRKEIAWYYVTTDYSINEIAELLYITRGTVLRTAYKIREEMLWDDRVHAKTDYIKFLESKVQGGASQDE